MTRPTRIPTDVNRPDRVLGPLTARQVLLLALPAALIYTAWIGLRELVALPVFLAVAAPIAAFAVAVAVGQRDGQPLDRYLLAALRHHLNPHRIPHRIPHRPGLPHPRSTRHAATMPLPEAARPAATRVPGERRLTARHLTQVGVATLGRGPSGAGVLELADGGLIVVAAISTLNLGLRSPTEQDVLLAGFARYLHTLTGPVQFLVRTIPLDLTAHLHTLAAQARTLPHPALAAAAAAHHSHLAQLAAPVAEDRTPDSDGQNVAELDGGEMQELLTRQVLLVLREPARRGAGQRLLRRLEDATGFLAPLDITVRPLTAAQITALLGECASPDPDPPSGGRSTAPTPPPPVTAGAATRQRPPDAPTRTHPAATPPTTPPAAPVATRGQGAVRPPTHRTAGHPVPRCDDVQLEAMALANDPWPAPTGAPAPEQTSPIDFGLVDDWPDDQPDAPDHDRHIPDSERRADHGEDHGEDLGGDNAWWWAR